MKAPELSHFDLSEIQEFSWKMDMKYKIIVWGPAIDGRRGRHSRAATLTPSVVEYLAHGWVMKTQTTVTCNLNVTLVQQGTNIHYGQETSVVVRLSFTLGVVGEPAVVVGKKIVGWTAPGVAVALDSERRTIHCDTVENLVHGTQASGADFRQIGRSPFRCNERWVVVLSYQDGGCLFLWKVDETTGILLNVDSPVRVPANGQLFDGCWRLLPGSNKLLVLGHSQMRLCVLDLLATYTLHKPVWRRSQMLTIDKPSPTCAPTCFFIQKKRRDKGTTKSKREIEVQVPVLVVTGQPSFTPCHIFHSSNSKTKTVAPVTPWATSLTQVDDSHYAFATNRCEDGVTIRDIHHPYRDNPTQYTFHPGVKIGFDCDSGVMLVHHNGLSTEVNLIHPLWHFDIATITSPNPSYLILTT
ncbi:hypothetical protein Pelo_15546 [Pelomyxa schiedti]|nr:hypothetical protein Pelo_15546 [Pelomyxa schiedti]